MDLFTAMKTSGLLHAYVIFRYRMVQFLAVTSRGKLQMAVQIGGNLDDKDRSDRHQRAMRYFPLI
jgi:hypothetical protein